MKKLLAAILSLTMVLSLAACGGGEEEAPAEESAPPAATEQAAPEADPTAGVETVTMKFAGTTTADPALGEYQAMLMVEELVEKYSEGTIDVEVYPASQLGSNVEFSEGVALGEIEAAVCGFDGLGNYAPVANALCMPYLFASNDDAMAKIWGDTEVHDALDKAFAEINMQIVGYVNRPFRVVCNNVRSVKTPADMEGLVLRSPTSAVNTAINSAMGAEPVTISWGEVYTSMSQGACTAVENAITELKSINLEQQCKYVSETNHTGGLIPMFVCKSWFDGLAPIQQDAILKGFAEVTAWREENLASEVDAAWQAFEDAGAEVVRLEDIDYAAFQEACAGVADEFIAKGDFTQDFYDALKG